MDGSVENTAVPEFRLLGPVEASVGGRPVPINAARQRVILVMLLMAANRVVTVERLADAVWDVGPPPTSRSQIQICIAALRRVLGAPGLIATHPGGYSIRVGRDQLDYTRSPSTSPRDGSPPPTGISPKP